SLHSWSCPVSVRRRRSAKRSSTARRSSADITATQSRSATNSSDELLGVKFNGGANNLCRGPSGSLDSIATYPARMLLTRRISSAVTDVALAAIRFPYWRDRPSRAPVMRQLGSASYVASEPMTGPSIPIPAEVLDELVDLVAARVVERLEASR